jgi:hypothetical protein
VKDEVAVRAVDLDGGAFGQVAKRFSCEADAME